MPRMLDTEMRRLWQERERQGLPVSSALLATGDDVFLALRQFLMQQAAA